MLTAADTLKAIDDQEEVGLLLGGLPFDMRFVLTCRYLWSMSLARTGRAMRRSRERVRQIEGQALLRLRRRLQAMDRG